jgi:hypothetical protein
LIVGSGLGHAARALLEVSSQFIIGWDLPHDLPIMHHQHETYYPKLVSTHSGRSRYIQLSYSWESVTGWYDLTIDLTNTLYTHAVDHIILDHRLTSLADLLRALYRLDSVEYRGQVTVRSLLSLQEYEEFLGVLTFNRINYDSWTVSHSEGPVFRIITFRWLPLTRRTVSIRPTLSQVAVLSNVQVGIIPVIFYSTCCYSTLTYGILSDPEFHSHENLISVIKDLTNELKGDYISRLNYHRWTSHLWRIGLTLLLSLDPMMIIDLIISAEEATVFPIQFENISLTVPMDLKFKQFILHNLVPLLRTDLSPNHYVHTS